MAALGARGAGASLLTGGAFTTGSAGTDADVVVVGAGASGLAAASRLRQMGWRVIVLEGRDRIGGRVDSRTAAGVPCDLGAAWFHSTQDNPLVPLARRLGMELEETSWFNTQVHDADGTFIPGLEVERSHSSFKRVMDDVFQKLRRLESGDPAADTSLAEAVRESIARLGVEGRPSLTDWQIAYLENDYAEDLPRLSLRVCRYDDDFHGPDLAPVGGYGPLMKHMALDLDIRLGHTVTAIEHSRSPVRLTTTGGTLSASVVLVTLPIGLLRESLGIEQDRARIRFSPELPARKVKAATRLGVGLMNKIILRFDRPFWPDRRDVFGWTGTSHGCFPFFVNASRLRGAPVLEALVVGKYARQIEALSDEATVGIAMSSLRTMFGAGVPVPAGFAVTRWGKDPFALGAYSYATVGASVKDREALGETVANRLFFAGEATHPTLSGTVHGAYLTGLREAERIARTLSTR